MKNAPMKKSAETPRSIGNAKAGGSPVEKIATGIDTEARIALAADLSKVLSETYVLYTKTQGYHWNVTGPQFPQLHLLFEAQYGELANAVDVLAERIRALGVRAPGDLTALRGLATIEDDEDLPDAQEMVARLLTAHETVARVARQSIEIADDANDAATADLLTTRASAHEKAAWMLRSVLA